MSRPGTHQAATEPSLDDGDHGSADRPRTRLRPFARAGGVTRSITKLTITIAGSPLAAQTYRVTGDLERELWYDGAGNWLQSRLEHDGATITLTRRTAPVRRGM